LLKSLYPTVYRTLYTSVADPDPNPPDLYVFRPPGSGSGSISQRYGSESGSFYHHAKIVRKNLDSYYFVTIPLTNGSGSGSRRPKPYGSGGFGSGYFYHHAKIVRKNLDSYYFVTLFDMLVYLEYLQRLTSRKNCVLLAS
jgi:hypothetical protein